MAVFVYCTDDWHLDTFHFGAMAEKSAVDIPACHLVTTAPMSLGGIPGWNFWVMGQNLFSVGQKPPNNFPEWWNQLQLPQTAGESSAFIFVLLLECLSRRRCPLNVWEFNWKSGYPFPRELYSIKCLVRTFRLSFSRDTMPFSCKLGQISST